MQWLNKVDDALDRVFPRSTSLAADEDAADDNERKDDRSSAAGMHDNDPPPVSVRKNESVARSAAPVSTMTRSPPYPSLTHDSMDGSPLSTSEEKLKRLASMMQQLEKDARDSGSAESSSYQHHHGGTTSQTVTRSQVIENSSSASIPLLPLASTEDQEWNNTNNTSGIRQLQREESKILTQQILPSNKFSRPPPPPPPPPPLPPTNNQWEPTTPRITQYTGPSPLPTPRMTPRTTAHPTPGIIRRKIRSPSISPCNSNDRNVSLSSLDDENAVIPMPPFIETSLDVCNEKMPPKAAAPASVKELERITPIPSATDKPMPKQSGMSNIEMQAAATAEKLMYPSTQIQPIIANTLTNTNTKDQDATAQDNDLDWDIEDDSSSSSTTFHSQISNRSDLTDDEHEDDEQLVKDFAIPSRIIHELTSTKSWDPSFNSYGIVHVRVLRAQRLPCAPGTNVVASLSLPPWKGRIRIPSHTAFEGPDGADVCVRWDKKISPKVKSSGSNTEVTEALYPHSMVHAYNNKDTPIPIVSLTLSVSIMGGVFEKFLCSVAFSCQDIMKSPGTWSSKWHTANLDPVTGGMDASSPSSRQEQSIQDYLCETTHDEEDDGTNPLIFLETCFEPKVEEAEQMISEDSDTLGPIPRDLFIRSSPENRLRHMPDTVYSSIEDDSVSKTSSITSALARHHSLPKSHLLRVRSFWTPAWCSVCNKVITSGWLQGSFECEACHIFCCKDCQLQVDISIPCGSELSKISVKKAQQYQLGQVMTTLAPYSAKDTITEQSTMDLNGQLPQPNTSTISKIEGVGVLSLRVLNACLFDKAYASDTEPSDVFEKDSANLRHGDHYVRISWLGSTNSKRTKTVLQAAKPVFDSDVMQFDVPHYGMEYKIEVVDANTDRAVGSCLLSPQAILQMHRDKLMSRWDQLLLALLHFRDESEPSRMKLELRSSVKDGFGLNFYNSIKIADGSKEKSSAGEISGWIDLDVNFEEDLHGLLYSSHPRQCPSREKEDFDIAMINLHIARISAIIEDIQNLASAYMYLISWENVYLTTTSLVAFVVTTLRLNLEYLGALPIGMLVIYMLYLGQIRLSGHFKDRWITKEKNALAESEQKIDQQYRIHRPVGLLQISKLRGKNLRSRELGLPGSFYVSMSYDPLRYANEKKKKLISKIDGASSCIHQIGDTISPGITSSPVWVEARPSSELSRLKHLLPEDHLHLAPNSESLIIFPMLQPITNDRNLYLNDNEDGLKESIGLLPWSSSMGAVVLQVRFSEVLSSFQLFENVAVLGEVVIPLSKLAAGREVEGWFRLLDAGTTETAPGQSSDEDGITSKPRSLADDSNDVAPEHDFAIPELYVKAIFSASNQQAPNNSIKVETSRVICEEMIRTASMSKQGNIGVMIGSSINTINTVRTLGGTLQNQLSNVVNIMEMVRNAFNFSSPRITSVLLVCLSILWMILAIIPTRIVVLIAGLSQYGATYYTKFLFVPKPSKSVKTEEAETDPLSTGNIVENLFLSIPTDEDLRRAYFWEAHRKGEREREKYAETKRKSRVKKLWKASWHGSLKVKEKRPESSYSQSKRTWNWESAFVLIEGHRLIWWRSEKHFDVGEAPLGHIFFAGHSGLAGLSPLDLRELSKEEIPFIVSVFGRGSNTQQKLTLMASTQKVKDELENAVLSASSDRKSD